MARPQRVKSIDAVTSATAGEAFETKGHNSLGVFVVARGLDTANDTVEGRLEAVLSPDNGTEHTAVIKNVETGNDFTFSGSDLEDQDGDGTYSLFAYAHGPPVEKVRVNITSFTDNAGGDLEVDAWIFASNWGGPGHYFEDGSPGT